MMKRAVLTFIGKDRPGIIAEVSKILSRSHCNIEDATMTILEGEFAMILIASVPERMALRGIRRHCKGLRARWGLNYYEKTLPGIRPRGEKHSPGTETYVVSVAGRDRTGIVYETSRILAKHRLNITDLNSKIIGEGERTVFTMILEVDVPKGFPLSRLRSAWRKLGAKLDMDVTMKRIEGLSL